MDKVLPSSQPKMWFVVDPCGIFCAIFTYALILYAEVVVMAYIIIPVGTPLMMLNGLIFNVFIALGIASHLRAMLSDPGTVALPPPDFIMERIERTNPIEVSGELVTNCLKCKNYKPHRAHHCSVCKRCVRRMDHHCPWVNNCVGQNNQKYFLLFVGYTFLMCVHGFTLAVHRLVSCLNSDFDDIGCIGGNENGNTNWVIFIALLCFEGLLFGIFTFAIMCDQLCGLVDDATTVERLQHKERRKRSLMESLADVCGTRPSYQWLLPSDLPRKKLLQDTEVV
eukprot:Opistho-2@3510